MCYDIHKGYSKGEERCTIKFKVKHPHKNIRALDLFTESVVKPDHDLRSCSHNQDVLMSYRDTRTRFRIPKNS